MRPKATFLFTVLLTIGFLFISCDDRNDPFRVDYSLVPEPYSLEGANKVETDSGLIYYEVKKGSSEYEVVIRDVVKVFYTKRNGKGEIMSSSYANQNPEPSTGVVAGSAVFVEQGFKEGVLGMQEGGIRVIFIPPNLHNYNSLSDDTIRVDVKLDEIVF